MKKNVIFRFDDIHPLMDIDAFGLIQSLSISCPESIMLCVIPDNKDNAAFRIISAIMLFGTGLKQRLIDFEHGDASTKEELYKKIVVLNIQIKLYIGIKNENHAKYKTIFFIFQKIPFTSFEWLYQSNQNIKK